MDSNDEQKSLEVLLDYLKQSRSFDFTGYKRSSLERRIRKRLQTHNLESFSDYYDYLQVHPEEFLLLFNTILINVTSFFRDLNAWEYLQSKILPNLLNEKSEKEPIRIWSAGCASGEEAYTLAIAIAEIIGIKSFRQRVKIYATDIDEEALVQARQSSYSSQSLKPIPKAIQKQYFELMGEEYIFRPDLRRSVIFGRHDLVQDAPISRLDLLVCRNTLMYFNAETQTRILNRFHFALKDSGILFLGKAEMLLTHTNLFTPLNLQHRIFRRLIPTNRRSNLLFLSPTTEDKIDNHLEQQMRLQKLALEKVSNALLIVDCQNKLMLANALARSMFKLNHLDLGRFLQDLEVSYRPLELRSHIDSAYSERRLIKVTDVIRNLPDRQIQYLEVQFNPLEGDNGDLVGVSIIFTDVTHYHALQEEIRYSNQELETTNEELQSANEELETTNEELQSTNEELETTNEELQSTNEELETTNEELQSTNEELSTMNDELRLRTTELNQAHAFLTSIFASLKLAVVVVDRQFQILTWNHEAENLWGIAAEKVLRQSLLALDIGLPVEKLREPLLNCLAGTPKSWEIVLAARNRRGRDIQCRIAFNPLHSGELQLRGVILLMEELLMTDVANK